MEKVNLAEKLALFSEHWSPKIIGTVDDYDVKVVKLQGDFVWHKHDDADELFLVIKGSLDIDFRDRKLTLTPGELPSIRRLRPRYGSDGKHDSCSTRNCSWTKDFHSSCRFTGASENRFCYLSATAGT